MVNLARQTDEQLLATRIKDLPIQFKSTWLQDHLHKLHDELAEAGLRFKPHAWLSSEWFSPDDAPGIAFPFYLAHERLIELERKMMLKAEGSTYSSCMSILRHECGHAIDTAYRLHQRRSYRQLFGNYNAPYPETYRPRPASKHYVLHLEGWYAQSHPAEDFAETFAVWLTPGSRWRQRYAQWPALKKLEALDRMMQSIQGKPALERSRRQFESLSTLTMTLQEFYDDKRERYAPDGEGIMDRHLRQLFSDEQTHASRTSAAQFVRSNRSVIRARVAKWTQTHPYTVDQLLLEIIERCKRLRLRLRSNKADTLSDLQVYLTQQTVNLILRGNLSVAL